MKKLLSADSAHFGTDFKAYPTKVILSNAIMDEIRTQVASAFPEEGCGLLLGKFEEDLKTKRVVESRPMGNVFRKEERYHRYTIDPKEFLLAENEAETKGLEVVGIYHSHPNAPARPSQFDREHAWPTLSYVVIEVRDSQPKEASSWILREDRMQFEPEEITIGR